MTTLHGALRPRPIPNWARSCDLIADINVPADHFSLRVDIRTAPAHGETPAHAFVLFDDSQPYAVSVEFARNIRNRLTAHHHLSPASRSPANERLAFLLSFMAGALTTAVIVAGSAVLP